MRAFHIVQFAGLLVLIFGAYGIFQVVDVEKLFDPDRLVNQLKDLGSLGPVVFIGFMVLAVVVSARFPACPWILPLGGLRPVLGNSVCGDRCGNWCDC